MLVLTGGLLGLAGLTGSSITAGVTRAPRDSQVLGHGGGGLQGLSGHTGATGATWACWDWRRVSGRGQDSPLPSLGVCGPCPHGAVPAERSAGWRGGCLQETFGSGRVSGTGLPGPPGSARVGEATGRSRLISPSPPGQAQEAPGALAPPCRVPPPRSPGSPQPGTHHPAAGIGGPTSPNPISPSPIPLIGLMHLWGPTCPSRESWGGGRGGEQSWFWEGGVGFGATPEVGFAPGVCMPRQQSPGRLGARVVARQRVGWVRPGHASAGTQMPASSCPAPRGGGAFPHLCQARRKTGRDPSPSPSPPALGTPAASHAIPVCLGSIVPTRGGGCHPG